LKYWRNVYDIDNNKWAMNRYWNPNVVICTPKYNYIKVNVDGDYIYNEKTGQWDSSSNGTHNREYDHEELKIINHETHYYWIDFLDDSYLEKYKVSNIGRRTKVINDNDVKAIFFESTPNVLFIDPNST
jgi:hypothetical protein